MRRSDRSPGSAPPTPRVGRPGRRPSARLLGLAVLLASACVGAPSPSDLLAVGFRTPRQAFRTFQTALRGDHLDLEYRCWSPAFRRRNGLPQHLYREGRRQLLEEQPWMRWIAKAEVIDEEPLGPAEHRLVCQVDVLWIEQRFEVRLVRTGYLEVRGGPEGKILYDEYVPFDRAVRIVPHPDGGWDLSSEVEIWPEDAYGDLAEATELHVAEDWQIDDLRPLDLDDADATPRAP